VLPCESDRLYSIFFSSALVLGGARWLLAVIFLALTSIRLLEWSCRLIMPLGKVVSGSECSKLIEILLVPKIPNTPDKINYFQLQN
jgi:hypothetical protein